MMDQVEPALRSILLGILEEMERQQRERVTRDEFIELRQAVQELCEAQKKTEERVNQLAEAQKKTEEKVNQLAEAQKKTEERVNQLAEAQRRTEERLNQLAEAQKRTEEQVKELTRVVVELTEAQKKTEKEIAALAKQVGGLSNAVGYGIEDRLMTFIPAYVQKTYGLRTVSLGRKNVVYPSGEYDEVNIFAEAVDPEGKKFYVIGECKAQPGKKDVDRFVKKLRRLEAHLKASVYPLLVGYSFSPDIERYISERYPFIKIAMTYEIEMIGRGQSFS
jgi:uncharacterized protein YoxC